MKALIISDGKPGHINQARAMCSIMGWQWDEAVVEYSSRIAKSASYLLDWLRIDATNHFNLRREPDSGLLELAKSMPEVDVVVSVGSASYYPAKVAARKFDVPVIALMYPRGFRQDFDYVLCPGYDNPGPRSNVTTLPVTLSNRNRSFYEEMTADFGKKTAYSLPAVSVIIGGDNKYGQVLPGPINQQLARIFELTPDHQHWVTTSRRTSPEVEKVVEGFPFDYKLIFTKEQYNPIPAFITLSEYLFVTSDSASMISECVSAGAAKVEVLKNTPKKKSKFDQFVTELEQMGCIHVFEGTLGQADKKLSLEKEIKTALADIVNECQKGSVVQ